MLLQHIYRAVYVINDNKNTNGNKKQLDKVLNQEIRQLKIKNEKNYLKQIK